MLISPRTVNVNTVQNKHDGPMYSLTHITAVLERPFGALHFLQGISFINRSITFIKHVFFDTPVFLFCAFTIITSRQLLFFFYFTHS